MNTSLSIFARALASENLSVSFDPEAPTASFDVDRRHLVMPVWDVSDTLQTMLIAHEISHALWTPKARSMELLEQAEKDGYVIKLLHQIANVIEDVRIEKLMKEKYPGTRRDFFLGYKEIIDADLFKFSEMDFGKAGLINRMNLHFKWEVPGFITLNLSPEEQEVADLIDAVVTFDDGFTLAKALYNHPSMDEIRKRMEEQAAQSEQGGGTDKQQGQSKDSQNGDGLGFMDTPSTLARKKGDTFNATSITLSPLEDISPLVCTTADTLFEYERAVTNPTPGYAPAAPVNIDNYRKFVRESDAFVRQLVAQFERRKAADEIRRERPKQTGMLNLDRLHQFRTHDDIFLSKIIKQDGKNHGIFFMIDFSGSMSNVLGDCILQVLQLVWFCEKAKIPFEVYGFTSGDTIGPRGAAIEAEMARRRNAGNFDITDLTVQNYKIANEKPNSVGYYGTRLYGLASSRDSAADRERLLAYLYETYVAENTPRNRVLSLGGTPTVEATMLATQFIKKWVVDNNIQIPTVMIVTDGQPNGVHLQSQKDEGMPYCVLEKNSLIVHNEILQTMTRVDTKKYRGINMGSMVVGVMLDDLKATLNARTVGMYVGPKTFADGLFGNFCITQDESDQLEAESKRQIKRGNYSYRVSYEGSARFEKAKDSYMNEGCIILPASTNPGYDAFFLIKTPKIVKDSEAIAESGNFTKVKNTFVKTMGKRAGSRVFLTKYVDIVAGQPVGKEGDGLYNLPHLTEKNK